MKSPIGIEERLKELGIELPPVPTPAGNYRPYILSGDLLYVSGVTPKKEGVLLAKGVVGKDISIEEAQQAARQCGIILLSIIQSAIGDLNRIEQLLKVTGYVSSDHSFTSHPKVVDGASNLFVEVLGDKGYHARCAVGVPSLPGGSAVELDVVLKVRPFVKSRP